MNLETILKILNIPLNKSIDEILNMMIIYLRKSRKDMDYFKDEPIEKTLQRHEKELQDYITNIFGKPIPEYNIYREVASGDTIDDRPIMQQVLSKIEEPNYKAVICIEVERLARGNTIDQGIIAQTFKYTNTKIITPMKIYDLDNEDDLSYFEDGLFQSRKYLKYTKRILSRGRVRSVKDGKYIGSVLPYGYNKIKIPNEKGYILVENESEASVVRLMAELFLNGLKTAYTAQSGDTVSTISKKFGLFQKSLINSNLDSKQGESIKVTKNLKSSYYTIKEDDTLEEIVSSLGLDGINKIQIPADFFKPGETIKIIIDDMRPPNIAQYFNYLQLKPRKSKEWTSNMIRNILCSYTIYGYLTWERRKTSMTLKNGKIVKSNPNNQNFLLVKGKHSPILSEEVGKKIKEKFDKNRKITVPKEKELKNPLVNLIQCGYCGNNMVRRPFYQRKEKITQIKRKYPVDETKLREFMRSCKETSNLSLNDIARETKISKYRIDKLFANDAKRFVVPSEEEWNKLKEILQLESTEFDLALTSFEKQELLPHEDTLMCSRTRCKCVGSNLSLVEKRVLDTLKTLKNEYQIYLDNYEEFVKNEIKTNQSTIIVIEKEIEKINIQIEKACELVETGAYSQDLFLKRTKSLNEQLENLLNQKEELSKQKESVKEFTTRKKAIPKIEEILDKYRNDLDATQKNALLSTVIKKIVYTKEKGGRYLKDNFEISIVLKFFD